MESILDRCVCTTITEQKLYCLSKSSCVSIHTRYNGTKLSMRNFEFVCSRYYISGNVKRHILDHHVCTTITQKIHRDTELSE